MSDQAKPAPNLRPQPDLAASHERAASAADIDIGSGASTSALAGAGQDGLAAARRMLAESGPDGLPTLRRIAPAQQQQTLLALQRVAGNQAVQRWVTGAGAAPAAGGARPALVQRWPVGFGAAASAAPPTAGQAANQQEWDRLVQDEVEAVLREFQNIPVAVRWTEDGKDMEEVAHVSPPYFINRDNDRKATAVANRTSAGRDDRALLERIGKPAAKGGIASTHVYRGKSTAEEIRQVLQAALDAERVRAGAGRTHPNAEDLRGWLVRYGIGVDCSAFVVRAPGLAPLVVRGDGTRNAASMRGGQREFAKVARPDQLRPGDTMNHPGHIRIVTRVTATAEGIEFATAESSSVGDVGPTANVWLFPDPTRFAKLRRERRPPKPAPDRWVRVTGTGKSPTFGRHQGLAAFQAAHTAAGTPLGPASE